MVPQNIRIGKIMGIEIGVNYSWFIVFGLVTILLSAAYFPAQYPKLSQFTYIALGLITTLLFFSSVLFHELSHSLVARTRGVVIKSVTLFIFGGVAQMSNEPDSPSAEFEMAIAGPLSSIVLGIGFGLIWVIAKALNLGVLVTAPTQYLALINVILAVFNLAPGFPLDGGRVFRSIIWYFLKDLRKATHIASWTGQGFAFLLIFLGLYFVFFTGIIINGIWFIFIGWFLYQAAVASYEQVVVRGALHGVKIGDIMTRDVKVVDGSINLTELVNEYFMRYKHGRFPVMDDGRLIGIITLHEVRDVPREKWDETYVRDVTLPLSPDFTIGPDGTAEETMSKMAERNIGHLLVLDDGQLVGIVTRSDLMGVIQIRRGLGE